MLLNLCCVSALWIIKHVVYVSRRLKNKVGALVGCVALHKASKGRGFSQHLFGILNCYRKYIGGRHGIRGQSGKV